MATVYSTRLFVVQGLSGAPVPVFTAPAGFRTVITSVNWTTGLNLPLTWSSLVDETTGARFAATSYESGTTDYTSPILEGRWVFDEGQEIAAETDGSTWDVFASGFLLQLP